MGESQKLCRERNLPVHLAQKIKNSPVQHLPHGATSIPAYSLESFSQIESQSYGKYYLIGVTQNKFEFTDAFQFFRDG